MANSYVKLDQALKDLIEAYVEVEEELEAKHGEDEEAYTHAVMEVLETSIEGAVEEQDSSTGAFATILSMLTEALEQLDPSAFEDEDADYDLDEVEYDADDADVDDADLDDADLDDPDLDLDDEEIEADDDDDDDDD